MYCLFYGLHPASRSHRFAYPALSYCVSKYFVKFVGLLEWRRQNLDNYHYFLYLAERYLQLYSMYLESRFFYLS
jgi:hypothetical protein